MTHLLAFAAGCAVTAAITRVCRLLRQWSSSDFCAYCGALCRSSDALLVECAPGEYEQWCAACFGSQC